MIDPFRQFGDVLRTLWTWALLGPLLLPLDELLGEVGLAVGIWVPEGAGFLLGGLIAGVLVGFEERRYTAVLLTSVLATVGWFVLRAVLVHRTARLSGSPRLVLAESILLLGALCLATYVVFYGIGPHVREVDVGDRET